MQAQYHLRLQALRLSCRFPQACLIQLICFRAAGLCLVSKAWRGASEMAQSDQVALTVNIPLTPRFDSYLTWSLRHTSNVKQMTITSSSFHESCTAESDASKLSRLILSANLSSPKLQHLKLRHPGNHWQESVGQMAQLVSLHISEWFVPWPGGCQTSRGALSRLVGLQVEFSLKIHSRAGSCLFEL